MKPINIKSTNDSNRLEVPRLMEGYHLVTLLGFAGIGTFETNFGNKMKGFFQFEFPQTKAVFYEGEQPQPYTGILNIFNVNTNDKSNFI